MRKNVFVLIIGIYIACSIAIIGYLYLNPTIEFYGEKNEYSYFNDDNFKYSILISSVGLILLYSILQLFKRKE